LSRTSWTQFGICWYRPQEAGFGWGLKCFSRLISSKKIVDHAILQAKRQAQAFASLEAHSEQADDNLLRRIQTLKRQLGIQQTAE